MKHSKDKTLQLQTVHLGAGKEGQTVTDLEFIMTNSAFGYEYALTALDAAGAFDIVSEKIRNEVDQYKRVYFDARTKLKNLDERHLLKVESDLKMQKLLVFSKQKYLH